MKITLQFLGGAGSVTGSKHLLTVHQKKYLIDCGLFQGLKELRTSNWKPLPLDPSTLSGVILTHAHIDHSGYLPLLVKRGFRGKIYTTAATTALCKVLLPDAGYLQEEDARFANKHGFSKHQPALPLFTMEDAEKSLEYFSAVPWEEKQKLSDSVYISFHPAGHILGAAFVQVHIHGTILTFSGDIGRYNGMTMNPPQPLLRTDYLVLESTYGNRIHPKENPKEELKKIIHQTFQRGGTLLIPSFAVGRAQQILFLLSQLKKEGAINGHPVYVNSPMAMKATEIFCKFTKEQALSESQCQEMMKTAHFVSGVEDSKKLNLGTESKIIISASGMATGGRILHHIKTLAPDPKNTILFVGFQAPGTRGEAIIHGTESVKIHGEQIPIRAKIILLDSLSAHADQAELMRWIQKTSKAPRVTFLNHGEQESREGLKKKIKETLGWNVVLPFEGDLYVLT